MTIHGFIFGGNGYVGLRCCMSQQLLREVHASANLSESPSCRSAGEHWTCSGGIFRQFRSNCRGGQCRPQAGSAGCARPMAASAMAISSRMAGSSMVAGIFQSSPSAILTIVPRRILPERVFGSRSTTQRALEGRHRADPVAHQPDAFRDDLCRVAVAAPVQAQEPQRHLALQRVRHPDHRAFGHVRWPASTSSIAPVDSRCPATLMTSSVRAMM